MATENLGPPRVRFDGDGATTIVPFDFPILLEDEILVYDYNLEDVDNPVLTLLTLTTDYTVTISDDVEGGEVTLLSASETDHIYILLRASADNQGLNIPLTEGRLNIKNIERALDRLALVTQELKLKVRQGIKFGVESEKLDIDIEDPIADHVLIWNLTADKVINSDRTWSGLLTAIDAAQAAAEAAAAAAAISAANAAASETSASVSAAASSASAAAAAGSAAAASVSETNAAGSAAAALVSETNAAASAAAAAASAAGVLNNVFAVQTLANGNAFNHTNGNRQYRPVISTGGEVIASFTPFGTNPANFVGGMEIEVVGTDDTDYVRIVPTDIQYGILDPRGPILLKRGVAITYTYDAVFERWVSKGRNT